MAGRQGRSGCTGCRNARARGLGALVVAGRAAGGPIRAADTAAADHAFRTMF